MFVVYHTAVYNNYKNADAQAEAASGMNRRATRTYMIDERKSVWTNKVQQWAPLAIGMSVFCAHSVLIPITGCSINPTRSLGPLIVGDVRGLPDDDAWEDLWIFIVAPELAALIAGLAFPFIWKKDDEEENEEDLDETAQDAVQTANPIASANPAEDTNNSFAYAQDRAKIESQKKQEDQIYTEEKDLRRSQEKEPLPLPTMQQPGPVESPSGRGGRMMRSQDLQKDLRHSRDRKESTEEFAEIDDVAISM